MSAECSRAGAPEEAQYPIVSFKGTLYYHRAAGRWGFDHVQTGAVIVLFRKFRYLNLLVVIIAMMVISPFTARSPILRFANNIVLTLVLLSVVNTVKRQRTTFLIGLILGIPWVLIAWLHLIESITVNPAISFLASMIFDAYIIFILLRHIIRSKRVTADILYGAVSVYILLGVFFASFYVFLDAITPTEMFMNAGAAATGSPNDGINMFYFSFVTLTTLGYGDIQPVADVSRVFAVIEAMTGVLYSAALIGKLIGLYAAQSGNGADKDPGREQ